jgi:hypothetical protein
MSLSKVKMKQIISTLICTTIFVSNLTACNKDTVNLVNVDLDSLMFSLDDIIYTLPVCFSELEANGWGPNDSDYPPGSTFANHTLKPDESIGWRLTIGEQNVVVSFINLSKEALPISECSINQILILIHESLPTMKDTKFILPGNIRMGSTHKDVIAAYGEPSTKNNLIEGKTTFYYFSDYYTLRIDIDNESNQVALMSYWSE